MEKKINKKQNEVHEAKFERAKRKTLYDSQIIIVEGQRNVVRELEARSEVMMKDYIESDNMVQVLMKELNDLSNQLEQKEEVETASSD